MYQTSRMAERVRVRDIDDDEGKRLARIVRRGTGSVVTWRRAQMGLLSATYDRNDGVRHLFAAYDLGRDRLFGHVKPHKKRTQFLEFCRYLRTLYPTDVRMAIVCDNFSPHLTTKRCRRVADRAEADNVEIIAYTPTNSSWLNRIEAQFTALRYLALDGTDHASHKEQASMIRRYIIWRNKACRRHTTTSDRRQGKCCLIRH